MHMEVWVLVMIAVATVAMTLNVAVCVLGILRLRAKVERLNDWIQRVEYRMENTDGDSIRNKAAIRAVEVRQDALMAYMNLKFITPEAKLTVARKTEPVAGDSNDR